MAAFLTALILLLAPAPARALSTTENALRIEDKSEGNVLLGADQAVLERGELLKTVVLLWGRLDIHGEVDEVVILSGHVTFHEGSKLNKSIVVMGGDFESKPGAGVKAESVTARDPSPLWRLLRSAGNVWRDHFTWIMKLAAAAVTVLVSWLLTWATFLGLPGLQEALVPRLVKELPQNLALGFLGGVSACVLSVVLLVSIIGIVFLPFYLLALAVAGSLAYSAAALWAGHRLLPPKPGSRLNPWGLLLGFVAFQFLWTVPVWGSSLPVLLLWTLAWGQLLRSLRLLWK